MSLATLTSIATPAATVREATLADVPVLALIGAATCLEAFAGLIPGEAILAHALTNHTPEAVARYLAQPASRAWLAEVEPGAAPIGYALLTEPSFLESLPVAGDLELKRLYLFSRFHGTGTGRELMQLAIASARQQHARRLLLGVHPDNARAIAFYKRTGFTQIGTRAFHLGPKTFQDPVFALNL